MAGSPPSGGLRAQVPVASSRATDDYQRLRLQVESLLLKLGCRRPGCAGPGERSDDEYEV
jgi:hypothetical protein